MAKTQRDPLAPIELVTTFLLAILGCLFVLAVVMNLVRPRTSSWGDGDTCATVDLGAGIASDVVTHGYITRPDRARGPLGTLAPLPSGVRVSTDHVDVCAAHPTSHQSRLNFLRQAPGYAAVLGLLGYIRVLTRRARRRGLFDPSVARGLSLFGGSLFVGFALVGALHTAAEILLLRSMLPGLDHTWANNLGRVVTDAWPGWSLALMAAGLLTLGRVMAHAVVMREELDATV